MFKNRQKAGELLAIKVAQALKQKQSCLSFDTVVIGLPRGGVPVAKEVAKTLRAPLTVLVSKKIGAPSQPELAIGAVSSAGVVVLNEEFGRFSQELEQYIDSQKVRLTETTKKLEESWLKAAGLLKPINLNNKRVVIVDDGVATGMTTLAAIRSVKLQQAKEIILAIPVIAFDTKEHLKNECDLIISLATPYLFRSVGEYYQDFHQVEDSEVIEDLKAVAEDNGLVRTDSD